MSYVTKLTTYCSVIVFLIAVLFPAAGNSQTNNAANSLPAIFSILLEPAVCSPPKHYFEGRYLIEQQSGVGPFSSVLSVFDTQEVNIASSDTFRTFDFRYSPSTFASDFSLTITLDCGKMKVFGGINSGSLSCNGGQTQIGQRTGTPISTYDNSFKDDELFLNVLDFDPDGGCNVNPYEIVLKFTKLNETPSITSNGGGNTASVMIDENTTMVTDVNATDPDNETEGGGGLSYSLSGADSGQFSIDQNGILSFNIAPNFENPADAGTDNNYNVTVIVTDSGGLFDTQDLTVTVKNVNEAPSISAPVAGTVQENTTSLTTISSSDPEGETDAGGGLVYSLSGDDAAQFNITSNGVWNFNVPPDFENPTDANTDNVYLVTFIVTDTGGLSDSQDIVLTIIDVIE